MFNSKNGNYSNHLDNTTLPMVNDTCNGVPKVTSTPLNPRHGQLLRRSSVLLSPTKSKLITPRRYSLSEMNPPANKSGKEAHSPGPLLASLNYKDNVSMYEETKSSGLARRIVLYNEEAEKERQPTHQEKYHSPGLFPIVHLFKKKPPPLEQSPRKVKIKLSSPDYLRHVPQERSKLLEGLARSRIQNQQNLLSSSKISKDPGTKSVLDALKEISRKRIHSNEESDLNEESGKRIRTELHNGTPTTSKRNRADSPLLDSSESPPMKQTQKKFCVYDEFSASKSSTDYSFPNNMKPTRSKRKTISTSTESLKEKETKQVKLINAETQTIPSSTETKTKSVQSDEHDSQNLKKKETPLKVFDDAPLDRIRRNRLAALMGNLAGKEVYLLPKPLTRDSLVDESNEIIEKVEPIDKSEEFDTPLAPEASMTTNENINKTDVANKPLMSILSPSKTAKDVSPLRSEKHVHFTIPGTTPSLTFSQTLLTQTSASIVTPIVSPSISNSSVYSDTKENAGFACTVSSANLNSKSSISSSVALNLFQSQGSSKSDTQISSVIVSTSSPSFNFSKPVQTSNQESLVVPKLTFEAPKTPSPQKLGGFKFELKTSSSDLVTTTINKSATIPSPSFSNPTVSTTGSMSLPGATSTTFTFVKPGEPKKDSSFSFGAATTVTSNTTVVPTFSFGGGLSKSQTFENIQTGTKLPSLNSTTSPRFSFGSAENTPMFGTNATTVAESSTFTTPASSNYSSQNNDRPTFSFTQNTPTTTTSAMFAFGGATAVTSSSGLSNKQTPGFGTNSSSATLSSMFENSGTTVVSGFGNIPTTTTSVFGGIPTTSTHGFGNTSATSFSSTPVTPAPIFGSIPNTANSVFGSTPVTSPAIFGNTSAATPAFGSSAVTSASAFGSTNASTGSGFGTVPPTTTSSVFGTNNSTFGSNLTTTAPVFGSTSIKAPAFGSSSGFGGVNTQVSTFGNNTTTGFENALQPKSVFGPSTATPNPQAFGSNTFGGSTTGTSTTTSAPVFGPSNPSSTFSFGSNKPTANVFGTVTTSSSTFGNNTFSSSTGFDQSSGFGNTNTPAFGSSSTPSNTFGATSGPAFGQVDNKPVFAFGSSNENKTNPSFGSGTGTSAFGKPTSNTQGGFGGSTGGFGTASTGSFNSQTNGGFNFGSNAASSPPAAFAFGGASGGPEPPKPTFNFTGGAANQPAFGSKSGPPGFGSSSNPSFGAPSFGASQQAAGVFNIGAGPNNGRPRTQLRAKRRT